jgi:hypothetical protein
MAEIVETLTDEQTGEAYWLYDDGSEKWCKSGHFKKPPTGALIRTSEQGRAMVERRISLARERTRQGIAKGLGLKLNEISGGEEWEELTRLFAEQFKNSKNIRGLAESYEKLGRAAGYINEKEEPDNSRAILSDMAAIARAYLKQREEHE